LDRLRIDEYLEFGFSPAQVINIIGKWLAVQKTLPALELAAKALIHVGQREDLQLLSIPIEPDAAADALRIDTAFAVKRRSLS
jgi:hypothetical protein